MGPLSASTRGLSRVGIWIVIVGDFPSGWTSLSSFGALFSWLRAYVLMS
jgi:hypothetical protein